eukprot:SAG31_NODE_309_length_17949_cov_11.083361_12_plen_754_part_00
MNTLVRLNGGRMEAVAKSDAHVRAAMPPKKKPKTDGQTEGGGEADQNEPDLTATKALATVLTSPETTAEQLQAAVAAGCIPALVELLKSSLVSAGDMTGAEAAWALHRLGIAMRPAEGASVAAKVAIGAFATCDGIKWGEVERVFPSGDVELLEHGFSTIKPAELKAVVASRSELVPFFEGFVEMLVDARGDVVLAEVLRTPVWASHHVHHVHGFTVGESDEEFGRAKRLTSTDTPQAQRSDVLTAAQMVLRIPGVVAASLKARLPQLETAAFSTEDAATMAVVIGLGTATVEQLKEAMAAGCATSLAGLLASADAAAFTSAVRALQKILLGNLRPAPGASTTKLPLWQSSRFYRGKTFATLDGRRWGEVVNVGSTEIYVKLLWLDDGSDSGSMKAGLKCQCATLAERRSLRQSYSTDVSCDRRQLLTEFQGVVVSRSDLLPVVEGWAGHVAVAGCVPPLLATFGSSTDGGLQLSVMRLVAELCRQAMLSKAQSGTSKQGDLMRQLVAAGLSKGSLVAANAAMKGSAESDESKDDRSSPAEQAKYMLKQLLKDTAFLAALSAAECALIEDASTAEEDAALLTKEGSLELARTRMTRMMRQTTGSMQQHLDIARVQHFYEYCSLSPDQMPLVALLAPQLLTSRRYRAAIASMVDGGTRTCDCSLFVAEDAQPWRCSNCKARLPKDRVLIEEAEKMRCEREDADAVSGRPHAERLRSFGLSVEFILALTVIFDCWSWPTWYDTSHVSKIDLAVCS